MGSSVKSVSYVLDSIAKEEKQDQVNNATSAFILINSLISRNSKKGLIGPSALGGPGGPDGPGGPGGQGVQYGQGGSGW